MGKRVTVARYETAHCGYTHSIDGVKITEGFADVDPLPRPGGNYYLRHLEKKRFYLQKNSSRIYHQITIYSFRNGPEKSTSVIRKTGVSWHNGGKI